MRHRPHVHVPAPWTSDVLTITAETRKHLAVALRYPPGEPVTYTEGAGTFGEGVWDGSVILRGPEREVESPEPSLALAVAPPKSKQRQRFVVEKLQELGVRRLIWIRTTRGQVKPPKHDRALAWAMGALEQSRGAWLMRIDVEDLSDVTDGVVADTDGRGTPTGLRDRDSVTVVVGAEGGLTEQELALFSESISIGETTLRTETAAVAVASIVLG
jgi:16S rRNA (uracil1498-N3)-methyltransferase